MSKKIIINNTTNKYFKLNYRMPGEKIKILEVDIIACALNYEVNFPSEEYYLEFKKQNAHYFDGDAPILIEGKATARRIEKLSTEIDKELRKQIDKELNDISNTVDSISREKTGKGLQMKVKKGAGQSWE